MIYRHVIFISELGCFGEITFLSYQYSWFVTASQYSLYFLTMSLLNRRFPFNRLSNRTESSFLCLRERSPAILLLLAAPSRPSTYVAQWQYSWLVLLTTVPQSRKVFDRKKSCRVAVSNPGPLLSLSI